MKSTLGYIAGVLVVVTALLSSLSAAPSVGRTLAVKEAWSLFGGSNDLCSTGMDRCYAWPMDCETWEGTHCQQEIVYRNNGGLNGQTCRDSNNEIDYCYELGNQEVCLEYKQCVPAFVNGFAVFCVPDPNVFFWTLDSVTGPEFGTAGDDCN
jgi:hypothetical protein